MNEIYRIAEDKTDTEYAIIAHDQTSGRLWLATTDHDYEAYDGDLILSPKEGVLSSEEGAYNVVLADSRTSLPRQIHLVKVKQLEKLLKLLVRDH